jgi:hypothetical protein
MKWFDRKKRDSPVEMKMVRSQKRDSPVEMTDGGCIERTAKTPAKMTPHDAPFVDPVDLARPISPYARPTR